MVKLVGITLINTTITIELWYEFIFQHNYVTVVYELSESST